MDRAEYLRRAREFARRGEAVGHAKLTAEKVRVIRARRRTGESIKSLAAEFGVHFRTIEKVCSFETWSHVT